MFLTKNVNISDNNWSKSIHKLGTRPSANLQFCFSQDRYQNKMSNNLWEVLGGVTGKDDVFERCQCKSCLNFRIGRGELGLITGQTQGAPNGPACSRVLQWDMQAPYPEICRSPLQDRHFNNQHNFPQGRLIQETLRFSDRFANLGYHHAMARLFPTINIHSYVLQKSITISHILWSGWYATISGQ